MNADEIGLEVPSASVHTPATRRNIGRLAGFWILLRLRARVEIAEFTHAKTSYKVINAFAYVFFLLFAAVVTVICWLMIALARSAGSTGSLLSVDFLLRNTPALLLSAALAFSLPATFVFLIQEFYLAKDLSFLFSLPIPVRSVIAVKIISAAMPGLAIFSLFYIPYLASLGQIFAFSPLFYGFMLVPLAAVFFASSAMSSLLVLLVVRFLPPRIILAALAGLLILVAFIATLLTPAQDYTLRKFIAQDQFILLIQMAANANSPFSPLTWAGEGLIAFGGNRWLSGMGQIAPLLLLCAVVYWGLLSSAESLYLQGFSRLVGQQRKPPKPRLITSRFSSFAKIAGWAVHRIPITIRTILLKDLRFYFRDLQYMTFLLAPVIMGAMMILTFIRVQLGAPTAAEVEPRVLSIFSGRLMEMLIPFVPLLFPYLLSVFFGVYILVPLVSLEGRSFWILRTTPVSPSQFLAAKYLTGLLILLPYHAILTLILQFLLGEPSNSWGLFFYAQLTLAISLAGLAMLYLSLGTGQACFDWIHPGKLLNITTLLDSAAGGIFIAIASLLFYALPVVLYAIKLHSALALLAGLISGGLWCTFIGLWQLRLVKGRVEKLFGGES